MQILRSLKNKINSIARPIVSQSDKGFSLLECILAVGILSIVLASLVGLQSSIIFVTQNSMDKLKAVWAMRQASSQLDYILDAGGLSAVPEKSKFIWPGDPRFSVTITKKNLNDVKPSQFLLTVLNIFNATNTDGNANSNVQQMLAPITSILDNTKIAPLSGIYENTSITRHINDSNFVNVFINVDWISGTDKKSFNDGLFLIDNNTLSNLKLPNFNSQEGK